MLTMLAFMGAVAVFLLGLRLSAFFSGAETGFYRLSFLRLSIEAHSGDRTANQILWFARNPAYFVATTLVGNNVANYITTLAIGIGATTLYGAGSGWLEILGTLLVSPVVFIFGELIPKNLYYRAPLKLLRRDIPWLTFFFRAFLVVSFPLIWITKFFERFGDTNQQPRELVLGRSRLVQVLDQGHREGLLSDVQNRLIEGLMHTAAQPVTESITPVDRMLGLEQSASREDILEYARRFGLAAVTIRKTADGDSWYGYIRVVDTAIDDKPPAELIREMPRIPVSSSKLEALLLLRQAGAAFGIVCDNQKIVGLVSERGLIEQLFRPPATRAAHFRASD